MTPESQRIAIAEECGWTRIGINDDDGRLLGRDPKDFKGYITYDPLPDSLTDLNAMHEAEKTLLFDKRRSFREELQRIMSRPIASGAIIAMQECIHATAAQRSEAFLRATGRWVES